MLDNSIYIEVPYAELSSQALDGLIKEFVLREGTDYGLQEYTLDEKFSAVYKQLQLGQVKIVYSFQEESCTIVDNAEFERLVNEHKCRQI